MGKALVRKRQSRTGCPSRVCVTNQRKNGMVERRRRYLDRSLLRRLRIRRQHRRQNLSLLGDDELLVVWRIVALLRHQSLDFLLLQKKLVKPCQLREHLQVGEVLRGEALLRRLRLELERTEMLVQLFVSWIPPHNVRGVRLKKILQREAPVV